MASNEKKLAALLEQASQLVGRALPIPEIPVKLETDDDKVREAQSVINFFTLANGKWETEQCRTCLDWFAYQWHYAGVKYCSVSCAAAGLKRMGLSWDPDREPDRRWGVSAPSVLPASLLRNLRQVLDDIPEDPAANTTLELTT